MSDLKSQILSRRTPQPEPLQAFGTKVYVRAMSGKERDAWEQDIQDRKNAKKAPNIRGSLAARSLCDETGKRLFTDAEAEQLGEVNAKDLDAVFDAATRMSGIGAREVKEMEKNS
jgi:hypothetical protein